MILPVAIISSLNEVLSRYVFLSISCTNSIRYSQYYCHFIHIGSWFNHRPNSCHRAKAQKIWCLHRCYRNVLPT